MTVAPDRLVDLPACRHPEVYSEPGIDFATGLDVPGGRLIFCLRCFEPLVETEEGDLASIETEPAITGGWPPPSKKGWAP